MDTMDTQTSPNGSGFQRFLKGVGASLEPVLKTLVDVAVIASARPQDILAEMNADAERLLSSSAQQLQRLRANNVPQGRRVRAAYRTLVAMLSRLDGMITKYRGLLSRSTFTINTGVSLDETQPLDDDQDWPLPKVHFWDRRNASIENELERAFEGLCSGAQAVQQATEDTQVADIPYLTGVVDELASLSEELHARERHLRAAFGKRIS